MTKATTNKKQSERFIKKAREIGVDESREAFERVLKKVIPVKRPPAPKTASKQ